MHPNTDGNGDLLRLMVQGGGDILKHFFKEELLSNMF